MPVKFSGKQKCEKCGEEFEWKYFELERQRISDPSNQLIVESLPVNITLAHACRMNNDGTYSVQVNCPLCDWDNHFQFSNARG